jgi:hypothetical protein
VLDGSYEIGSMDAHKVKLLTCTITCSLIPKLWGQILIMCSFCPFYFLCSWLVMIIVLVCFRRLLFEHFTQSPQMNIFFLYVLEFVDPITCSSEFKCTPNNLGMLYFLFLGPLLKVSGSFLKMSCTASSSASRRWLLWPHGGLLVTSFETFVDFVVANCSD